MILQRINAISCGRLLGALYAGIGFMVGVLFSLLSLAGVVAANPQEEGIVVPSIVGIGAFIILPVLYGLMGFIGDIIFAFLYNVVASVVGGIEFDMQERVLE